MKILVPVKRVVDYNVKIRVKAEPRMERPWSMKRNIVTTRPFQATA